MTDKTELNRLTQLAGLTMESARGLLEEYSVDEGKYGKKKKKYGSQVDEAGGYYTQPVYDMIEKHGYEKVMHELLTSLHADVIQDFLNRADIDEAELNELGFSAPVGAAGKTSGYAPPSTHTISSRSSSIAQQKRDGSQAEYFSQYADDFQHDGADRGRSTMSDVSIQKYDADGNMTKNDSYNRFVMPGGAGIDTTNGVTKNIQMKGPQSWAYDKPKLSRIKREGKYVSDAQRKAVHASKAEKK